MPPEPGPAPVAARGCLVTGTDTGAGKSVLAAALVAALVARGERVRPYKPVLTGTDERGGDWPPDDELLALAAGRPATEVAPLRFGPAVSPHLAAALAGTTVEPGRLVERARELGRDGTLVVEGIGGLLAPLRDGYAVRELAVELGLPVLVAARPGLGTINHALLTLAAAREGGLDVRAVVLTPWPAAPDAMLVSNRDTIARAGAIDVHTLGHVAAPRPALLAAAAAHLPLAAWLAPRRRAAPERAYVRAAG